MLEFALGATVVAAFLLWAFLTTRAKLTKALAALERYSDVQDIDAHKEALARDAQAIQGEIGHGQEKVDVLKEKLSALQRELGSVEDAIEIQSFGVYKPRYGFPTASAYEDRLERIRDEQKSLIKEEQATHCPTSWTVDGDKRKGRKMIKEHSKLMLRAFNGESDAAIAKVKYNNVKKLETRIDRAFTAINKLGESKQIHITQNYLNAKLSELYLVHEHREKVRQEEEEQKRIREQMREEQKAEKELAKIQADAEKEEERYQRALERAREELRDSQSEVLHEKLKAQVDKLESELSEAIDRKAKATARAQLTKSGHVYVLSNIGSFGERVYKIGMTRRLEPLVRVKELGDASVPFAFDVHAMIYSENAPELERLLHQEFDAHRVNKSNNRKEYFRIALGEIRKAVAKHHGVVTFEIEAEAEEYRKTVAIEAGDDPDAPETQTFAYLIEGDAKAHSA